MNIKIRSPVKWVISHAVQPQQKGAVAETTNTYIFKQLIVYICKYIKTRRN